KAARRVTITYGLRWEVNPAPHSLQQVAVLKGPIDPTDVTGDSYASAGKPFYRTSWLNFAPRLGIGWHLRDKTVIRFGAGRFFDLGQGGFDGQGYHAPTLLWYKNQPLGSIGGGNLSTQITEPITGASAVAPVRGYTLPYTWQWNVTLEQAIGQQTL